MKNVLVLYYSQSGMLRSVVESVVAPLREAQDVSVTVQALEPAPPFTFPWSVISFLDVFPDCVQGCPCPLRPLPSPPVDRFDVVILGYTAWYLKPSLPVASFLQSPQARTLLQGASIVTVVACRNMWLMAHERVRELVRALGARLVGNIVLADRAWNLVSVITIMLWMLSGRRERRLGLLPRPGISDQDVTGARRFGDLLLDALRAGDLSTLQSKLKDAGAARVHAHLLMQERFASRAFRIWARFIRGGGASGNWQRNLRLRIMQVAMPLAILVGAPLLTLVHLLTLPARRKRVQADLAQFHQA
jgi:hypothetical protein